MLAGSGTSGKETGGTDTGPESGTDTSSASSRLPDGTYRVISGFSGKALDVGGCSKEAGAPVIQWPYWAGECQQWHIEQVEDGFYRLTAVHSGKVLEVPDAASDDNVALQVANDEGGEHQQWAIESVGDGLYTVTARHSGKGLDIRNCSPLNTARITQSAYSGSECQQWQILGPEVPAVGQAPVFELDFPDPFILRVGETYHAYATNINVAGKRWTFPRAQSTDLVNWELVNDVMPVPGPWATPEGYGNWAPDVLEVSSSSYVFFYVAVIKGSGQHCIGRAVSSSPTGPFTDSSSTPFICNTSAPEGFWSLDPSPFRDQDGKLWLLWRQDDGSAAGSHAYIRQLDETGTNFAPGSSDKRLLSRDPGYWEEPIIENPAMVYLDGQYVLFYSGNRWETAAYGNGYAICQSVIGPCEKKTRQGAWLSSLYNIAGAGGLDVFTDASGAPFAVMHGWVKPKIGYENGGIRAMWIYRLGLSGFEPRLDVP